ncbi:MAG: hypothetical protein KKI08_19070, partial [Armatimonadetes bacterium]|nr:hypothetical protein [Armatimonadota bacterium]
MSTEPMQTPTPCQAHSLCIDGIGSTMAGMAMTEQQFDRYNQAMYNQVWSHVERLGIDGNAVKFTGDGWVIVEADPERLKHLAALALVMRHCFRSETALAANLPENCIPHLRQAIASGRDLAITSATGTREYVGDSVRRAVRNSQWCGEDEIVLDESSRHAIFRNFNTSKLNPGERPPPEKQEEESTLYLLDDVNPNVAQDVGIDCPDCLVYLLEITGRNQEAEAVLEAAIEATPDADDLTPEESAAVTRRWNRLVNAAATYARAVEVKQGMDENGIPSDVFTYSILIARCRDYDRACEWLERMQAAGIAPNVVTYNTLLNLAGDYATAQGVLERMQAAGIAPDVVTYSTL